MRKTSHKHSACPTARAIERVGDTWSVLILREAFYGATRFDDFQKRLGIAPNMLTRRLTKLVDEGLLERRAYSAHPPRDDYVLTARGRDFRPVLLMLMDWGTRHFADQADTVQLVERQSGRAVRVALVDADTGQRITEADHYIAAGPAASPALRARLDRSIEAQPPAHGTPAQITLPAPAASDLK
ncbi:helix-turn-helix domain-containing protein [Cupriavidus pauculus]|uniref:winged helix-turn-helix transcriptional regulator n=1 Tax=Cupriavidus pauculus TaxID=82633 RepID=UPI001EE1DF90|nr:helix-turn-helix domain-containing protein [Cupriavidus pauculus]GJG95296.1 helix-turn-helix transcriptional regulator [Cupriavidus pauculus]